MVVAVGKKVRAPVRAPNSALRLAWDVRASRSHQFLSLHIQSTPPLCTRSPIVATSVTHFATMSRYGQPDIESSGELQLAHGSRKQLTVKTNLFRVTSTPKDVFYHYHGTCRSSRSSMGNLLNFASLSVGKSLPWDLCWCCGTGTNEGYDLLTVYLPQTSVTPMDLRIIVRGPARSSWRCWMITRSFSPHVQAMTEQMSCSGHSP